MATSVYIILHSTLHLIQLVNFTYKKQAPKDIFRVGTIPTFIINREKI